MKISRDTFKARCRVVLADMLADGPQPLFAWLHRLEALLARPPVERRPTEPVPTKGCRNSADVARANGWGPGTVIVGDEGYGLDAIRIDYLGQSTVLSTHLAKQRDGYERAVPEWRPGWGTELAWTLSHREWRLATPEELAEIEVARAGEG